MPLRPTPLPRTSALARTSWTRAVPPPVRGGRTDEERTEEGDEPVQGPPPRRKRHVVRNVLAGIGGLVVVLVIIAVADYGSPGHTVTTGTVTAPASASATASPAGKLAPAEVGSALTLAGNSPGAKIAVTVVRVIRDAQPAGEFDTPQSGDRLYAVQFRLADTGSVAYSDSPTNGAAVVDSSGQSYQSSLDNASGCQSFPGTENIAPGSSGLGCITFEVPQHTVITKIQFTLDSGFGPQTGQWDVNS